MASSDIKVLASPTVAVQGRAVVTDAPIYLLKTTQIKSCAGVAIRGEHVAILLHADGTTTKDVIQAALCKAHKMDTGDLSVQYICHEDEEPHCMDLMQGTPGATCVGRYPEGQSVIVCMDNVRKEIYTLQSDLNSSPLSGRLYKRLNEIVAWTILYNCLEFETHQIFGKPFLETINDVKLAKEETVHALRLLKRELVTEDVRVDYKEVKSYIQDNKGDARIVTLLRGSNSVEHLYKIYGEDTIAEGLENSEEFIQIFHMYNEKMLDYAKEINDSVTSQNRETR